MATLAKIFNGGITKWNDPAIAALNPGATLPDTKITRSTARRVGHHRQLPEVPARPPRRCWTPGAGKEFKGGVGEGAQRRAGVIAAVRQPRRDRLRREWSFADQSGLHVRQDRHRRRTPSSSPPAAGKAVEGVKVSRRQQRPRARPRVVLQADHAGAYPIMLATYEIVCSKYCDPPTAAAVKAFLPCATGDGQRAWRRTATSRCRTQFQSSAWSRPSTRSPDRQR